MTKFFTGGVTHDEAVAAIKSKPVVIREVFDKLLQDLKARAFTVTGIPDADVMQRIRDRIADLPQGGDWDDIKRDLVKDLSPYMVDPDAEPDEQDRQIVAANRRAELLLRTHGFQAYAATQYRNMRTAQRYLPYWKYITVGDDRVRASHAALHGLILPADHPFWDDHYGPWDWGCRCQATSQTERAYKKALANPTPEAWTLGPEAMKRLADGVLDKGDGHPVTIETPRLRAQRQGLDPDKAYSWKPGDLEIPLEKLRERYDDETWAVVEKLFAKPQHPTSNIQQPTSKTIQTPPATPSVTIKKAGTPNGYPVSKSLAPTNNAVIKDIVARVSKAIDSVHGDGALPNMPVQVLPSRDALGRFNTKRIQIRTDGNWKHLTLVHETGHDLDYHGIGQSGRYESDAGYPPLDEVLRLLKESPTVKIIESRVTYKKTYWLDKKELWARAYAQYIALRSGDPTMLAELNRVRASATQPWRQWSDSEFEVIADAIDIMFKQLGWIS